MSPAKELKRDHQTAFRPIGEAAAATDALKSQDDDDVQMQVDNTAGAGAAAGTGAVQSEQQDDGEPLEHPVEEIESLCMQCGENVSWSFS